MFHPIVVASDIRHQLYRKPDQVIPTSTSGSANRSPTSTKHTIYYSLTTKLKDAKLRRKGSRILFPKVKREKEKGSTCWRKAEFWAPMKQESMGTCRNRVSWDHTHFTTRAACIPKTKNAIDAMQRWVRRQTIVSKKGCTSNTTKLQN